MIQSHVREVFVGKGLQKNNYLGRTLSICSSQGTDVAAETKLPRIESRPPPSSRGRHSFHSLFKLITALLHTLISRICPCQRVFWFVDRSGSVKELWTWKEVYGRIFCILCSSITTTVNQNCHCIQHNGIWRVVACYWDVSVARYFIVSLDKPCECFWGHKTEKQVVRESVVELQFWLIAASSNYSFVITKRNQTELS